jgi:hypothetical protein
MYYIKGLNESLSAIQFVTGVHDAEFNLSDHNVKAAYAKFLKNESVIENYDYRENINLIDFNGLRDISPSYCEEKSGHFLDNSKLLTDRLRKGFFDDALVQLSKSHPEIFRLANFVIKIIVINQLCSHTNGTTADMVGLICMDFKDHFETNDFIEDIVHQMTHTLLFLDNFNQPHMIQDAEEIMIETGLKFVLGGTKFPAYLAFHSYLVGVEILYFRMNTTGLGYNGKYHGDTDRIFRVCDIFRKSLIKNIDLFTPRGQSFLNDSFVLLDNIYSTYKASSK